MLHQPLFPAGTVILGIFAASCRAAPPIEVAAAVAFTEGPAVDGEGNVYFSDLLNQRIMKLGSDGILVTFREPSNVANGLLIDAAGRLVACEGAAFTRPGVSLRGEPRVTRTDLGTGRMEVLAERHDGGPLQGPNDVTVDGRGSLYFTDLAGAAVYRIDTAGVLTRLLAAPQVQRPNGVQVSPDDRTLYVADANPQKGGARLIRAYELRPEGSVGGMRVLYDFGPGRGADGLGIDREGNLYAAAGLNHTRRTAETLDTRAGVYVISPAGRLLDFVPIPEDLVTNVAFGGPDMKTLYVTAGKTLYKVRRKIAGLPR